MLKLLFSIALMDKPCYNHQENKPIKEMDGLSRLTDKIDYQRFLSRLDMKWDPMVHRGGRYYPERGSGATRCDWGEAALIGNGMIGAAIYKKTADGITLELGRNDVEAHNHLKGVDLSLIHI